MYDMIEKTARKPSTDPVQERLRQNKALWNKDVSAFVNDLIHLKKLMNGWPSKFFKERSRIGDPIPSDPATIIGSLASDFQDLAQRGNALVREQIEYAKGRKKKQPKAPPGTTPPTAPTPATPEVAPPAAPDLTKQLAAFEQKYELVAEASSPISRFFTKLLTPTMGTSEAARIRRARMAMLNASAKSYKDLGKVQVEIVKSSKDSINSSMKKLNDAWNSWVLVARGFTIYKDSMPIQAKDQGGEIEIAPELKEDLEREKEHGQGADPLASPTFPGSIPPPADLPELGDQTSPQIIQSFEEAKSIVKDYQNFGHLFNAKDSGNVLQMIGNSIDKFKAAPKANKVAFIGDLIRLYGEAIRNINNSLGTSGQTLKDIAVQLKSKPATPEAQKTASVEKVAQDFLRKWVGKKMHQLSFFDQTSSYRLDIYNMAEEIRVSVDQVMDLLEKGMDVTQLDPLIRDTNRKMVTIRGMMRALHYSGT